MNRADVTPPADEKTGQPGLPMKSSVSRSCTEIPVSSTPPHKLANEALNRSEFQRHKIKLESYPSSCHLELTTRCNFYCPHCSKGYDPYRVDDLSPQVIDHALEALLPSVLSADITGFGEPTLSPQYAQVCRSLIENGVRIEFNTNTSTLTSAHIEMLVKSGAHIILSIDGGTRETFEAIRAGG